MKFASPSDLLADIDSYVMSFYLPVSSSDRKVSDILSSYYLGGEYASIKTDRIKLFSNVIGLGDIENNGSYNTFSDENHWLNRYVGEVSDSATMVIATTQGKIQGAGAAVSNNPIISKKGATHILKAFSKSLINNWGY